MNDELQRIFLAGVEVRRLDEETFDFVVERAGEPEGFEWLCLDLIEGFTTYRFNWRFEDERKFDAF